MNIKSVSSCTNEKKRRKEESLRIYGLAPPHRDDRHVLNSPPISAWANSETLQLQHVPNTSQHQPDNSLQQLIDSMLAQRPKQERKGVSWQGWPKSTSSSKHWWRPSKMCFEVDAICHTRSDNQWFYYSQLPFEEAVFQPSMQLRYEALKYDRGQNAERRVNITLDGSSRVKAIFNEGARSFQYEGGKCNISPVPTHVSLQSLFNFMIGEFYVRTLLPLHLLMTSNTGKGPNNTSLPWEQNIQLYVHFSHGDQKLYDGHKLLLSGMLSTEDAPEVKSMLDLFDVSSDHGEGDCECFEKTVFCGYDVYVNDTSQNASSNSLTPNKKVNYTLWNAGNTANDLERIGFCGKDDLHKDIFSCNEWADLRKFLASNLLKRYSTLEDDIFHYRRDVLIRRDFVPKEYNGTTQEWTFVGLAQRSYRRSWINLPDVLDECNSLFTKKAKNVVCVEVNVEKTLDPYEQLILHRASNALIGVHGAQMTQAVLLPQHGHVLELLPWVPENYNLRGLWVQIRHGPTPLGVIFHNTDLNHLGYSLGRDSVPLCKGVGEVGSEKEKACLNSKENRKSFIWESRNFVVDPNVVLQYIEQFVLANSKECKDMSEALDDEFVLYNVWCEEDGESKSELKHYYDTSAKKKRSVSQRKKSSSPLSTAQQFTTDIDIVSLTVKDDFPTLFNSSAIASWMRYIRNIRSITFIGPESDYSIFLQHLKAHHMSIYSNQEALSIPIKWVNETHWMRTYKSKHRCAYAGVCQQLIKLHVFHLKTHLGLSYIGDNILIVDSDTVWSREVTFVHPNGTLTYFERIAEDTSDHICDGKDPVRFTEAISIGRVGTNVTSEEAGEYNHKHTKTPYKPCIRPQYPNATGARHIVHFMLFQQDVMNHLHDLITQAWGTSSLWASITACHNFEFCKGRIAEYELYYSFVSEFYPERMLIEQLTPGKDWMNSAICNEKEMKCCRDNYVLLKGCHDHRIKNHLAGDDPGDMCCELT